MPLTSSRSHRDLAAHAQHFATNGDGSTATTSITRLEAHAAVRLDLLLGKSFDCYGLPLRRSGKDRGHHFSFIKSVKGLASYLTTRINPSFQECLVRVVELESDVRFEVRQISAGRGTRARLLFAASLSTLVDVARDSVIEKDTVVFSQLPTSLHPTEESGGAPGTSGGNASGTAAATAAASSSDGRLHPPPPSQGQRTASPSGRSHSHTGGAASRKEELISTLFSAYGDIGLNLVFHAARGEEEKSTQRRHASSSSAAAHGGTGGSNSAARPYTRAGLRFVSTAERNEWLTFCGEAYMGLLLDSIRTNRDTVYVPDDSGAAAGAAVATGGAADGFQLDKPSEEAVENYIDFFLSARTKADGGNNGNPNAGSGSNAEMDPLLVPFGGALRIRGADGSLHLRSVHVEQVDEVDDAGLPVVRGYLVFRRKRWPGKYTSRRIPLEGLQVYAEDDQTGSSFFLEFVYQGKFAAEHASASSRSERTSTANELFALGAVQQSFLSGTELAGEQDAVALECETGSFAARRQWLQWVEVSLRKPVVYLSVLRRKAAAQKPVELGPRDGLLGDRVVW